jgi:hypothetical protein
MTGTQRPIGTTIRSAYVTSANASPKTITAR